MKAWLGHCVQALRWWFTVWLRWVLWPWMWWRYWRSGTVKGKQPVAPTPAKKQRARQGAVAKSSAPVRGNTGAPLNRQSAFTEVSYPHAAGEHSYKLYGVPVASGQPVPLVVMLHGCKQSPDDFALGTRMNHHADARGCMVLYPAQSRLANGYGCWNWFNPKDQARETGETAILAGMIRQVMAHYPVDPGRVVVMGLSAGAAMAVNLACAYPELVRGLGVHSGLPYGAARGALAALKAMKEGSSQSLAWPLAAQAIPSIIFHGDADEVVHPVNSEQLLAQRIGTQWHEGAELALQMPLPAPVESETMPEEVVRSYTRRVYLGIDGKTRHVHWLVHGLGHAWSGGDAKGSYTDPAGPDATQEMLQFLLGPEAL